MDPSQNAELTALFRKELEESSVALIEAGRDLLAGTLDRARLEEVIRHAHTVKGSAGLMTHDHVSVAAAQLEQAWRAYRDDRVALSPELAASMTDLATRLRFVFDAESGPSEMAQAVTRVGRAIGPHAGGSPTGGSPTGGSPTGDLHTVQEPSEEALSALGGLLTSAASSLREGVTRVETGELYRLINRLVEVALDTAAVADLTLVNIEGADPKKVMAAWRSQLERLARSIAEVQDQAVSLANVSFREAAETFPQFIRYLGRKLGKDVRFELSGDEVELDRQIVDQLREPLRQLLVNAVDHGIEAPEVREELGKSATGTVSLHALVRDDRIQISVSDDGAGIDWGAVRRIALARGIPATEELTPVLLRPEFSTRSRADDFSGHGDGLAVVADVVARVNGGMQVDSVAGAGTTVLLTLPVSLVLQNMVVVVAGEQFWGLAEAAVIASMALSDPRVQLAEGGFEMRYQGTSIPVVSLSEVLGLGSRTVDQEVVVVVGRSGMVAVTVPEIVDRRRVAVKDLGPILSGTPHITAAAFLGGGEVLVVLDANYLADQGRNRPHRVARRPSVLVVDDSAGVRQLIAASLNGAGFDVVVAAGAGEAIERLADSEVDLLVVDYSMPRRSGVDLVRSLRAGNVELPIVMVSGVATAEEQAAAWEAGVDAYMDKFDLRKGVLTATLRRLLETSVGSTA